MIALAWTIHDPDRLEPRLWIPGDEDFRSAQKEQKVDDEDNQKRAQDNGSTNQPAARRPFV
jgi:hypothetical protein